MSNKEIAIDIINTLTEDQLTAFITLFAPENIQAKIETEQIANDKSRKHYSSFSEIAKEILSNEIPT